MSKIISAICPDCSPKHTMKEDCEISIKFTNILLAPQPILCNAKIYKELEEATPKWQEFLKELQDEEMHTENKE